MARSRKRKPAKKQHQQPVALRRSPRLKNSAPGGGGPKTLQSPPPAKLTNCPKPSGADTVSCSVCLDTSRCRVMKTLACKHTFHARCVARCLEKNPHCPLCRAPCFLRPRAQKRLGDDIHDSIMNNMIFYAFLLLDQ